LGFRRIWPEVVAAIEQTLPLYDAVNDVISLGRADEARIYGVRNAGMRRGSVVLDSGIGPGSLSKILLNQVQPRRLVGLDYSTKLLHEARAQLASFGGGVELVRGAFERAPFKDGVFEGIFTAYAFRDALDKEAALREYSRMARDGAPLVIVDIGKPSNRAKRFFMSLYIRFVMPMLAKLAIRWRIKGNPWRMIVPTYRHLPTTSEIVGLVRSNYGPVIVREFLLGGIAVVTARRMGAVRSRPRIYARPTARRRRHRGGRARAR